MNTHLIRQTAVILAVIAVIVVNGLANALPLNGLGTGEISDRFDVYFVPAGYVFSIWGLIYLGLIAYAVYQALPSQRENPRLVSIGWLFVLSCAANILWLFCWHYLQFAWSVVVMLMLLVLLIAIYLRLNPGFSSASTAERWMVHVPFSVYLGWITIATIANITSFLDYVGWNGWGIPEDVWAAIMLAAAAVISLIMARTRGDVGFLLVVIWAAAGIALKHALVPRVSLAAWGLAAVAFILMLLALTVWRRWQQPRPG